MLNNVITKKMLWDNQEHKMVIKSEVVVQLVTNKGTVVLEAGPLYCANAQEIFIATMQLKEEIERYVGSEV